MAPDLYELLGVPRSASNDDLKKAYRAQARRYHPDLNPDDPQAAQRFKEVNWAYEVLSDQVRRAQYDRFGRVFTDGRSQGPFGVQEDFDLGDIVGGMFRDMFGGRRKRKRKQDLKYTVTVTLEESARGTEKEVSFDRKTEAGTKSERLRVKVPPGVDTGTKLKVRGKGQGETGDLYVVVNVADHVYFRRRSQDIFCDVPVTFAQALLGAELEVPTVLGPVIVRLPPNTQPGSVITLKGKGLPRLKRGNKREGDQFCKIVLDMPQGLDAAVQSQLLELDRALSEAQSPIREAYERILDAARSDPSGGESL
ncbi:MAG: DnaJ domain-containing protein [Proteobacteria bacterium]|nr:DnaJ domain-containing protein [Pseudomonadota bacterium]